MEKERPDNIVFSEEQGYNASLLPYSTNVGAPAIKIDDVVSWKSRGISMLTKSLKTSSTNSKYNIKI